MKLQKTQPQNQIKMSSKANGIVSKDNGNSFIPVPKWVCEKLGAPRHKIAHLEVNDLSGGAYSLILDYLAHHAVDISENFPEGYKKIEKSLPINISMLTERELPGRLSSLIMSMTAYGDDSSTRRNHLYKKSGLPYDDDDEAPPRPVYFLGLGCSHLKHEKATVCVLHEESGSTEDKKLRSIHLFAEDEKVLRSLGNTAFEWCYRRHRDDDTPRPGKHALYCIGLEDGDLGWAFYGWKKCRPLESIYLPRGMVDSILKDLPDFSSSKTKKLYEKLGIPRRRSYLFHGPPGVGKTSTIQALSSKLNLAVCYLTAVDYLMYDRHLLDIMNKMPRPAMLVIEDIDLLFNEDGKSDNAHVTFSALLNILDGILSMNDVITFMTTKKLKNLDSSLIRPGRVDRAFEFKLPSKEQFSQMFSRVYKDAGEELGKQFAEAVFKRPESEARSIPTMQQHFIFTRESGPQECINKLDSFFKEFYPEGGTRKNTSFYM